MGSSELKPHPHVLSPFALECHCPKIARRSGENPFDECEPRRELDTCAIPEARIIAFLTAMSIYCEPRIGKVMRTKKRVFTGGWVAITRVFSLLSSAAFETWPVTAK